MREHKETNEITNKTPKLEATFKKLKEIDDLENNPDTNLSTKIDEKLITLIKESQNPEDTLESLIAYKLKNN